MNLRPAHTKKLVFSIFLIMILYDSAILKSNRRSETRRKPIVDKCFIKNWLIICPNVFIIPNNIIPHFICRKVVMKSDPTLK